MTPPVPLIALVLCGGGGLRLWPISGDERPKQFLKLFGEHSLFQNTMLRLEAAEADQTLVLTSLALEHLARADLAGIGKTGTAFVLEPSRRDSGPAIAAGVAAILEKYGPDVDVLIVPSDHLIPDHEAFARTLHKGRSLAAAGYLVTFGIRPTFPSTEYGYIQRGAGIAGVESGFGVVKFHEKPTLDRATAYLADPAFAWNAGIFLFRASTFASEAAFHMPDIWEAVSGAVKAGVSAADTLTLDAQRFARARRISIDFALFERSSRVGMVPASFAWSDIGGWNAVHEVTDRDSHGMATRGPARHRDCSNTLLFSEGLPIHAIGLDGFVVIASPNGVFIAPKGRAQEIKSMLDTDSRV